ncbi:MAG: oligosaccharide flippase family protein, partial [Actinomycetota bacterium]
MNGLRALALKGGVATAGRQVLGMAISFAGLAALVRLIGAASYGVYVSAFALYGYASIMLGLGIDVWLVRKTDEPDDLDRHQAFTLAVVAGIGGILVSLPGAWAAQAWIGVPGLKRTLMLLFATLPVQFVALVPSAILQRRLAYGRVAVAELSGLTAFYAAALPLGALGLGTDAAVAGLWAQQVTAAVLLFVFSGYRPRLAWRAERLLAVLSFGLPFATATWMWHLRALVNPLVVARLLGPEAAATVGIALRMAESLSFMRQVAWRVALPAMSKVQSDPARLSAAIADGMRLQLLVTGPIMLAFSLAAPLVIPLALGRDWTPMVGLFPFLALAYLANCVFGLHFPALHVTGRNGWVGAVHVLHAALLFGAASLLVPRYGLQGYGF